MSDVHHGQPAAAEDGGELRFWERGGLLSDLGQDLPGCRDEPRVLVAHDEAHAQLASNSAQLASDSDAPM